jgi:transposase
VKLRIHPSEQQKLQFRRFAGTHRFMWNQAKSLADQTYSAARATAVEKLELEHDGYCRHQMPAKACASAVDKCKKHVAAGCAKKPRVTVKLKVSDERVEVVIKAVKATCCAVESGMLCGAACAEGAAPGAKARYFCELHIPATLPGVAATLTTRNRPFERLQEGGDVCRHRGCEERVVDANCSEADKRQYYCVEHVEQAAPINVPRPSSVWSFQTLRNALIPPNDELEADAAWLAEVPYNTRQLAVKAYADGVKSFFEVRKSNPRAEMPGFLSRKAPTSMFNIDKASVSFKDGALRVCPTAVTGAVKRDGSVIPGSVRMSQRDRKRFAKELGKEGAAMCDAQVTRDACGKWYFVQPIKTPQATPAPQTVDKFDAGYVDPGGRTFLTVYSPDGVVMKIGDGLYELLKNPLIRADKCASAAALLKNAGGQGRKVVRIKRRAQALRTKVRNVVRDLHRKTCVLLCSNFTKIFLPTLDTVALTHVGNRVINSKAVRNLMTFAHGEFRVALQRYAAERGVTVTPVSEAYTTKTCTNCGHENDVGAAHHVQCTECGVRVDRDIAGSRNIALRCLTQSLGD